MTATQRALVEALREKIARIIDPFPWTYGMNGMERDYEGPEDAEADKEAARQIADRIISAFPALARAEQGAKPSPPQQEAKHE